MENLLTRLIFFLKHITGLDCLYFQIVSVLISCCFREAGKSHLQFRRRLKAKDLNFLSSTSVSAHANDVDIGN